MPRQTRVSRVPPPENHSGAGRQNTASGEETQQRVVQGRGRPRAPATAAFGTPVNERRRAVPTQSTSRTSVPVLAGGYGSGYSRDARMQMRGSRPIGITGLSPVMRGRGGVSTRAPRPQILFRPPPEIKVPTEPPEIVTLSDDDDTSITSNFDRGQKMSDDSDSSSDLGRYSPSSSTSSNVSDGKAAVSQLFKALTKAQKKKEPSTLMCRDGVAQCQSSDSDTEASPNKASKTFSFAFGNLLPIMEEGATGERGVAASQTYIDELQVLSAQLAIDGLSKDTTSGAGPIGV